MAVEKKKAEDNSVEGTLKRLNTLYGHGTVVSGNEKSMNLEVVSTGSLLLDQAIGIGGFPYGRIVEIIGPESSGKTTVCGHVVANGQADGKLCAYVDMEHALDMRYMKSLGVDPDKLLLSQPDYGESALEIVHQLAKTGAVKIIIVDSVATLVPKSEVESGVGDPKMAGQGRMMSQALRVLSPVVESNGVLLVFTNQIRMQPGVMYGSPEKPSGGESLKFYASIRLDMRKTPDAENGLNKTRIKVIKSKVSKPFGYCEPEILWGSGFNRKGEIVECAVEMGIITKSGSWFSQGETKIGQGIDSVIKMGEENPEWLQDIENQVIEKLKQQ